ncbi:hypothetical protein JQC72_10340 [Polycladomyces sp. WAk]|uniref:Uncharacterized protein n=1 Tax=Polycladomyces zharkentensis TaxID=2807616 RepID=A0ABS2WK39_9BACL|nr:hypothetical protein [Polycladomyces sp. WAk]MBN2909922.1 hypothetical protein [Polycladomyces sp. WAk]
MATTWRFGRTVEAPFHTPKATIRQPNLEIIHQRERKQYTTGYSGEVVEKVTGHTGWFGSLAVWEK